MLSGMLDRPTQSLLLTPDGPLGLHSEPEMRRFADPMLVPIIRGNRPIADTGR